MHFNNFPKLLTINEIILIILKKSRREREQKCRENRGELCCDFTKITARITVVNNY